MDYEEILKEGEFFYTEHTFRTLCEIKDILSVFKAAKRLPNCFWNDISDIHATNYSSIYNLTFRLIEHEHPGVIGVVKPLYTFLEWIYNQLLLNSIILIDYKTKTR